MDDKENLHEIAARELKSMKLPNTFSFRLAFNMGYNYCLRELMDAATAQEEATKKDING